MPVPIRSLNVWTSVIQVVSAWVVTERVEAILELRLNSGSEYEDDASGKFTDPFRRIEHQKSQGVRLKEVWVPGSVTVFGCSYYTNHFLFASPHLSTISESDYQIMGGSSFWHKFVTWRRKWSTGFPKGALQSQLRESVMPSTSS